MRRTTDRRSIARSRALAISAACAAIMIACERAAERPAERGAERTAERPSALPTAGAIPGLGAWEEFDFAKNRVDSAALDTLSLEGLRGLRAIVFGRHGRSFADEPLLHAFLSSKSWYHADTAFSNSSLSDTERENLDAIRGAEAARHPNIQTGDMRYHRGRVITTSMLGRHTRGDWEVIAGEVEAVHGKVFDHAMFEDPADREEELASIQVYFSERYWYRPDSTYKPSRLTAIERANLDTITVARMHDLGLNVSPGMMYLFQARLLSDTLLRGVSLYELRVLRNEVYARRGRQFRTAWLRDYFTAQPWYKANPAFRDTDLSEIDTLNVKLITRVEARRHEELSTKEINDYQLGGLFPEDARRLRNEILARHGRTFVDPKLQAYFRSLDWYKPDPGFNERSLTDIEKRNIATILAHEERAKKGQRYQPG